MFIALFFFFLLDKPIQRYFISVWELWGVLYLLMLQPLFIYLGLSVLNELKPVTDGVVYHIRFNHSKLAGLSPHWSVGDIVSPHLDPVSLKSSMEAQAHMQRPAFSFMLNDPY